MLTSQGSRAPLNIALSFLFGIFAAALFVFLGQQNTNFAIILILAFPSVFILGTKPGWIVSIFLFCLLIFEEFPSVQGETLERSQRTPFYSLSIGIPGLYSTDIFLAVSLGMYLIRMLLLKEPLPWVNNKIAIAVIILGIVSFVSTSSSIVFGAAIDFSKYYDVEIANLGEFDQTAAALIGLFHMKIFSYLLFSYFLGLFYFRSYADMTNFLRLILYALGVSVIIGIVRIALNPGLITSALPLFYHSPSSWIFAIAIFYFVGQWSTHRFNRKRAVLTGIFCAILFAFILLSLRRTMWGAMFVASIFFMFIATVNERKRLYPVMGVSVGLLLAILLFTPIGAGVLARAGQTNVDDASSFYRFLLFVYIVNNWADIPLLGWGVEPLWNFQDASVGYFRISLENIHSLYFWILLRFGILGFLATMFSSLLIAYEFSNIKKLIGSGPERWIVISIILAMIMLLFSGLFNPVYGEARYMVLTGFALSLLSKLPTMVSSKSLEQPR